MLDESLLCVMSLKAFSRIHALEELGQPFWFGMLEVLEGGPQAEADCKSLSIFKSRR
jgi:hypothetical protein